MNQRKEKLKVNGVPTKIDSPNTTESLASGMVHQHFMLVEEIQLSGRTLSWVRSKQKFGLIDKNAVKLEIMELSKKYHLAVQTLMQRSRRY